jgi:hypothetical protein
MIQIKNSDNVNNALIQYAEEQTDLLTHLEVSVVAKVAELFGRWHEFLE